MKIRLKAFSGRFVLLLLVIATLLLVAVPVFASQRVKDRLYENNGRKDICSAVQTTIRDGMDSLDVVRTAIELGNSPCLVVKCAIKGGGKLKKIIKGAMEAGASPDVVSKCAIDAGANSREVSAGLLQAGISMCYFEPEGLPYSPPENKPAPFQAAPKVDPDPPISPSSF